jgi:hypothetical protein
MFIGSLAHLRSSIAAGAVALALTGSLYLKAPPQSTETTAFLGRWSSQSGSTSCTTEAGFVTFSSGQLQFTDKGAGLDFTPSHTTYRRSGDHLTLAMAMPSPDGEVDWNVELAINDDGTLSYKAMSGNYVELAEMAYGTDFERDFSQQWAKLRRCQEVAANF